MSTAPASARMMSTEGSTRRSGSADLRTDAGGSRRIVSGVAIW